MAVWWNRHSMGCHGSCRAQSWVGHSEGDALVVSACQKFVESESFNIALVVSVKVKSLNVMTLPLRRQCLDSQWQGHTWADLSFL